MKAGRLANEAKALRDPSEKSFDDGAKRARLSAVATLVSHAFAIFECLLILFLRSQRAATRYQLTIDLLDVWLPATGLGLVNVNDGVAGILGLAISLIYTVLELISKCPYRFITSVLALQSQWNAVGK